MESNQLTLPERFALYDPNSKDGLMALRLTFTEWIVRGLISLESRVKGQSNAQLGMGDAAHSEDWFTLQDSATANRYAQGTGVLIVTALRQAGLEGQTHPLPHAAYFLREAFGVDYTEFHRRGLIPQLMRDGLVKKEAHQRLLHWERVLVSTGENAAYWQECNVAIDLLLAEIARDAENLDVMAALAARAGDALFFRRELDSHLVLIAKAVRARAPQLSGLIPLLDAWARYGRRLEKALTYRS